MKCSLRETQCLPTGEGSFVLCAQIANSPLGRSTRYTIPLAQGKLEPANRGSRQCNSFVNLGVAIGIGFAIDLVGFDSDCDSDADYAVSARSRVR